MNKKQYNDLKSLLTSSKGLFGAEMFDALDTTNKSCMLWYSVNGDIERKHTCGIFLKEPKGKEVLPTLIVYIDSHALLQDFRTNKNIYLSRLALSGLELHDIQFQLSKESFTAKLEEEIRSEAPKKPLVELSSKQLEEIKQQVQSVSENLRETVYNAMVFSYREQLTEQDD